MKGSVMVIGSGVAGLNAALELTSQGFKVVLVEKKPSLGGRMTQLDKMFPTGDCGMCTILPKLLELTSNPNVQLMPYCEVKEVRGRPGDLEVTVLKKPRYVDWMKCNACTACFPACPVGGVPMEFNYGKGASKAISFYSAFPPRKAIIFADHCAYLKDGKCGDGDRPPCVEACKPEAILFQDKATDVKVNVGAIIVATGLSVWRPAKIAKYGFGVLKNVVTGIDYERMLSGIGPTGGLIKKADGSQPRSVAFIQCVGPKDELKRGNTYCSAVCCMAATMEAIGTIERDADAKVTVFHDDVVAYAKNFQEQYRAAVEKGVEYVRGKVDKVSEKGDGLVVEFTRPDGSKGSTDVEMVVLSTNLVPNDDNVQLAKALGIELDEHGFFKMEDPVYAPLRSSKEGIYIAGTASGPKDISASIATAAGASANAISLLKDARDTETVKPQRPEQVKVSPTDEPRIGVMLCHCGQNIAGFVDMDAIEGYCKKLPNVVVVERDLFACGGGKLKTMIKENNINRVVIGACSPKTHEHLFQLHTESTGLNKYLMELVNLRNHCTWVHTKEKEKATEKCNTLMKMGVARAQLLEALEPLMSNVVQRAMVIGGGITGLTCAKRIADMGFDVHLVEKGELGGKMGQVASALGSDKDPRAVLDGLVKEVTGHELVTVHTGTTLKAIDGFVGQFNITLDKKGKEEEVMVGAVVVATGAADLVPEGMYGYGKGGNVITLAQLEGQMLKGKVDVKGDGRVVMISCVGSKEPGAENPNAYCCGIGCSNMVKDALAMAGSMPDLKITVLHQDWNLPSTVGEKARMELERNPNVELVRCDEEKGPEVMPDLTVKVVDADSGKAKEVKADMVVLTTALVAQGTNERLKQMMGVCLEKNNFFMGALGKLKPLDFTMDGVYLCGTAHSPKGLDVCVAEAQGAASRAGTIISRSSLVKEPTTSFVVDENCDGCAFCIEPCPFNALTLLEYAWQDQVKKTVQVNETICKGCGVCMATCPKQGIYVRHFRPEMFLTMIEAALGGEPQ